MVKGTTRQVLVVRPQESDLFEQAIFCCARRRSSSTV